MIGLDRFTDRVCARLPDLKVISMCSAGVDHIDPAILNKYGIKMWWAAGINKVSVAELAVCYMVYTVRRAAAVLLAASRAASGRARSASAPTCADARSVSTAVGTSARRWSSCCSLTA